MAWIPAKLDEFGSYADTSTQQYGITNFLLTMVSLAKASTNSMAKFVTDNFDRGGNLPPPYTYHAQAHFVPNGTVNNMTLAFAGLVDDPELPEICDLASRLMSAIQIVAIAGQEGDIQCAPYGMSGTGAFLHVGNPDGSEHIHINFAVFGNIEQPELFLRERFDAEWTRAENPCPLRDSAAPVTVAPASETAVPFTSSPVSAAPITTAPFSTVAPVIGATSAPR